MDYIDKIRIKLKKAGFPQIDVSVSNGGIRLTGQLSDYEDVLLCGKLAVNKRSRGVINDIKLSGYTEKSMRVPAFSDNYLDNLTCDALIVGGGIVGCAIARELTKYNIDTVLIEKEYDLATAQSSRNDGMIHAGIDLKPNSLKVKYNMRGNKLYDTISKELDVPIKKCGQCVLYTGPWQKLIYPFIKVRAAKNKILLKPLSNKGLAGYIKAPGFLHGGFYCGGAGVINPFLMTAAFAENAVANGAKVYTDTAALAVENNGEYVTKVVTNRGVIYPKVLINAAGVYSDKIAEMAGDRHFTIHPRKGVEAVIDTKAGRLTRSVIGRFAVKSSSGKDNTKGGGVILTVDGNLIIGPNAHETPDREDVSTSREDLEEVYVKQSMLAPGLKRGDIITYFAGVRASTYEESFVVERSPVIKNFIQAAGIQSPGITAAPAIAQDIARFSLDALGKDCQKDINVNFNPIRKGIPCVKDMTNDERDALIKSNPDYGVIVCRCEQVSKGEIIDAINSPVPCLTIDGIKRRVRAGMGRCQGGFCAPVITRLIAEKANIPWDKVTKKGDGSEILPAKTKGAL